MQQIDQGYSLRIPWCGKFEKYFVTIYDVARHLVHFNENLKHGLSKFALKQASAWDRSCSWKPEPQ